MRVSAALPVGVAALFFEAAERRRRLEGRLLERLEGAGYREVILPILDYLEPYEPLLAAGNRAELYRFLDQSGEELALRADFTPLLARLLAPRLAAVGLPLALFYRGDVVRRQEAGAGHLAELYQLGVERIGETGPAADAAVVRLLGECLLAAGAPAPQLVLGFAGALDGLLLAAAGDAAGALAERVARRERQAARASSSALLEIVEEGRPADPAVLGEAVAAELARLDGLVAELGRALPGLQVVVDLAEFALYGRDPRLAAASGARGYYDGVVFRAYVGRRALPVAAGGRYDSLFARLGAAVPAVGFSLGIEGLGAESGGGG